VEVTQAVFFRHVHLWPGSVDADNCLYTQLRQLSEAFLTLRLAAGVDRRGELQKVVQVGRGGRIGFGDLKFYRRSVASRSLFVVCGW
jgi:hypothetical protein